ncbi:MAG: hypothetical protein EBR82_59170 [Caulobacteraceae bacterium]|nr:hypothetical protein [Caulobacteraceae bacterium]
MLIIMIIDASFIFCSRESLVYAPRRRVTSMADIGKNASRRVYFLSALNSDMMDRTMTLIDE